MGYSIPFLAGVRMRYADRRRSLWFCGIFLAAMVCAAAVMADSTGTWLRMQPYKYPPRGSISCCGGTTVSLLLWSLRKYWSLCSRAVRRCSSEGTPSGSICGTFPSARLIKTSMTDVWWGFRFLLIYAIALTLCLIQSRIVGMCEKTLWFEIPEIPERLIP